MSDRFDFDNWEYQKRDKAARNRRRDLIQDRPNDSFFKCLECGHFCSPDDEAYEEVCYICDKNLNQVDKN